MLGGVNSKSLVYNSFNLDKELTQVNPVDALTSGKIKKSDVGKTVYLSNGAALCQEWLIADVNHDGIANTIDLISKYVFVTNMNYGSNDAQTPCMYEDSIPHSKMRGYLSYFDKNVVANLCDISVKANGYYHVGSLNESSIQTFKIHMPSITELGYGTGNSLDASYQLRCCVEEGSVYPLFDRNSTSNGNPLCKRTAAAGDSRSYWARSCATYLHGSYAIQDRVGEYYIDEDGRYNISSNFYQAESFSAIAIIRFTSR